MSSNDPLEDIETGHVVDDPPPIFRTWAGFYAFVLALHSIIIVLFYIFTRAYA